MPVKRGLEKGLSSKQSLTGEKTVCLRMKNIIVS